MYVVRLTNESDAMVFMGSVVFEGLA